MTGIDGGVPPASDPRPVAIIGSGFAGTILARALHARGRPVVVLERDAHPRFALGESSTPLAAIALERLADGYGLDDLRALAAYGRWRRALPDVGHGLKRGFSFYAHRRGEPYRNGPEDDRRLLVAASPDDEIADSHWLRADVDHHLVRRARREGVTVRERFEVVGVERIADGWRVHGTADGRPVALEASFLVDATGAAGVVPQTVARRPEGGDPRGSPGVAPRVVSTDAGPELSTGLVFAHFAGVEAFEACAPDASFEGAPYPEGRAAVHHLLDEGWMYVLPFDDGRVSAGIVLDHAHPDASTLLAAPSAWAWREVLARYPSLAKPFAGARALCEIRTLPRLQRRAPLAAGDGFALLPHTFAFASPLFSTGIAWSLLAVERLARILGDPAPPGALSRYASRLADEADHIARIVAPAYRLRRDFDAFVAWSFVYFAAASRAEARQRLLDPPPDGAASDEGFLGATDSDFVAAVERLSAVAVGPEAGRVIGPALAPFDLIGLERPARTRRIGVDLEMLVARADRIGLDPDEARRRLPRLRGEPVSSG